MYVLKDSFEAKKRNCPVYLKDMSGIGPVYTESLDEAKKFETKEDAMMSPAFNYSLCFFYPEEI